MIEKEKRLRKVEEGEKEVWIITGKSFVGDFVKEIVAVGCIFW